MPVGMAFEKAASKSHAMEYSLMMNTVGVICVA